MQVLRNDREMIEHPERWPNPWFLPMRRPNPNGDSFPELGLILLGGPCSVVLAGMYPEEKAAAKRLDYPTVGALLADGWLVD